MAKLKRLTYQQQIEIATLIDEQKKEIISWKEITELVKPRYEIKNWLDVRGAIQILINEKMIIRTKDVYVEEYKRI